MWVTNNLGFCKFYPANACGSFMYHIKKVDLKNYNVDY